MRVTEPVVIVIDDEASVRHSLIWLLDSISIKAFEFSSAQAYLDSNLVATNGCLVVDVRMPGISGLQLQKMLRDRGNQLPIIFLSAYGDGKTGAQAIKDGAIEFLQKPYQNQELLDAVNAALEVCSARNKDVESVNRYERLSLREKEVLSHIANGWTSKEIASALQISHKTVEAHRASVLKKLEVKSACSAMQIAFLASNKRCLECRARSSDR